MNQDKILKSIDAKRFSMVNGKILRAINILEGEYVNLATIESAISNVKIDEFHRGVVFLQKANYIKIRNEDDKKETPSEEIVNKYCESTLTEKGIRLVMGFIKDDAVEM